MACAACRRRFLPTSVRFLAAFSTRARVAQRFAPLKTRQSWIKSTALFSTQSTLRTARDAHVEPAIHASIPRDTELNGENDASLPTSLESHAEPALDELQKDLGLSNEQDESIDRKLFALTGRLPGSAKAPPKAPERSKEDEDAHYEKEDIIARLITGQMQEEEATARLAQLERKKESPKTTDIKREEPKEPKEPKPVEREDITARLITGQIQEKEATARLAQLERKKESPKTADIKQEEPKEPKEPKPLKREDIIARFITGQMQEKEATARLAQLKRKKESPKTANIKSKPVEIKGPKSRKQSTRGKAARKKEEDKPNWKIQKEALEKKFEGASWRPPKRVSPDAVLGIRDLHKSDPTAFNIEVLAQRFKISKEAVRRILKSKFQPSDEEMEDKRKRWGRRGEKVWKKLSDTGVRPPKKWREMGVSQGPAPWKKGPGGRRPKEAGYAWDEEAPEHGKGGSFSLVGRIE